MNLYFVLFNYSILILSVGSKCASLALVVLFCPYARARKRIQSTLYSFSIKSAFVRASVVVVVGFFFENYFWRWKIAIAWVLLFTWCEKTKQCVQRSSATTASLFLHLAVITRRFKSLKMKAALVRFPLSLCLSLSLLFGLAPTSWLLFFFLIRFSAWWRLLYRCCERNICREHTLYAPIC